MKLTEKSEITFDLKFILLVAGGLLSLSASFFTLKADIEEAKKIIQENKGLNNANTSRGVFDQLRAKTAGTQ